MRIPLSLCVAILTLGLAVASAQPKYGVSVKTLDKSALANARTYAWKVTQPSFDKAVDGYIVAAVDRELAARGLTKLTDGRSDVTVTYASLRRTDVDTGRGSAGGASPEYAVGTLVVDMAGTANSKPLFSVRMDTPIAVERSVIESTVNGAVAAMFEKYPVPAKR